MHPALAASPGVVLNVDAGREHIVVDPRRRRRRAGRHDAAGARRADQGDRRACVRRARARAWCWSSAPRSISRRAARSSAGRCSRRSWQRREGLVRRSIRRCSACAPARARHDADRDRGHGLPLPAGRDPAALWQLLLDGADAIGEVPARSLERRPTSTTAEGGPGNSNTRNGGFISDADAFDNEFFGITPREAEAMDPQQRLLLQTAWRALEDATLDPRAAGRLEHRSVRRRDGQRMGPPAHDATTAQITAQDGSGNGYFMTANRLSYQLDLKGPSLAVDTACSSSLVAVHLAAQALRSRRMRPGGRRRRQPHTDPGAERLLHAGRASPRPTAAANRSAARPTASAAARASPSSSCAGWRTPSLPACRSTP